MAAEKRAIPVLVLKEGTQRTRGREALFNNIQAAKILGEIMRTSLGPRGLDKMLVDQFGDIVITNDGATILKNVKSDNPITQLFKNLAISQEEAVGDGTTSAVILAGELLENALDLLKKGVHQTTIINGYSIAMMECLNYLNRVKYKGDKLQIIKTAFGSKIPKELANLLANLLINEDVENLYFFQIPNSNPLESYPAFHLFSCLPYKYK